MTKYTCNLLVIATERDITTAGLKRERRAERLVHQDETEKNDPRRYSSSVSVLQERSTVSLDYSISRGHFQEVIIR